MTFECLYTEVCDRFGFWFGGVLGACRGGQGDFPSFLLKLVLWDFEG